MMAPFKPRRNFAKMTTALHRLAAATRNFRKFAPVFGGLTLVAAGAHAGKAAELSLPAPGVKNCATNLQACGYPNASNTGPRRGTVFTRVPQQKTKGPGWAWEPEFGRLRITGRGAILDSVEVHAPVVIDAPDVTVSNSKIIACNEVSVVWIRAGRPADGYNADNARVIGNQLGCDGPLDQRSNSGVKDIYGAADGLRVIRNNIYNVSNGITVDGDYAVIRRNFIHDLGHQPDDHHSGISTHGGDHIVIDFNTVLIKQGSTSAPIVVYSGFSQAKNPPTYVSVTRNIISGGSYCFFGGDDEGFVGVTHDIYFKYNRLSRIYGRDGNCGQFWGDIAFYSPLPGEAVGNVWDDTLRGVKP